MSGRRASDRPPPLPDDDRSSERGDTLIEVLLALVILGIAGVALLTGFATSITASATHRSLATLDSSVRTASNEAISQVQQSVNNPSTSVFSANTCTNAAANPPTNTSYTPNWSLSGGFTVQSFNVQYWNGTTFGTCTNPYGPQLWTMNIGSGNYGTQVSTVIYDPGAPSVTGGTTPTKLVFMQPTNTGSGTVNAAVSPQPIVAVEDVNGNIVYSDASSVTLTASGGTGKLSNNCSGVENNGVVSFSGCSFSAPGTYTVTASDGSLTTQTATYTITAAPVAKLVFTSSQVTQVASAKAGTSVVTVQEQDAFGTAVPGALTVNLSTSSSSGLFSLTSGGTAPVTSVSIPAGQSSTSFYYGDTTAGSPVLSASASGLQTGAQTETINGATPVKAALTATPSSAGVSSTTNVTLGLQLVDQYGNNTTAGTGGTSLALSTSSTTGFFSATNNASSSSKTATVSFASGVGTATEYYGDKTVGTPTITAKNGTSFWGTAPLTITVGPPATITLNSGSGQSTLVNTATGFSTPLLTTVTDAFGNAVPGASVTFSGPASGASVSFGTCSGGNPQTYQCVVTTNASGQAAAPTFTADTTAGTYSISASASGTNTVNFSETNTAGSASQVTITPTPNPSSASSTTNTALAYQLTDQYGNATKASTGGVTLTLSTSSSKGIFATTNGASGSATASVSFASGVGTATNYYGDQTAGSPTVTAKVGSTTWGTGSPTITAKTTLDVMTIVGGSGQSTTAGSAFTTPLAVQDVDQFGNPVSGANVTFSAPVTGASGTFGTCSGGNPQTYQCVVATNASGQAISPTFTANTVSGSAYSVTTAVSGVASPPAFSETNTAGAPAQVYITPTPTSAAASTTTSIKLGFQLVDQYGNNATAGTGGVTLSVSSTSTKDFFSSANGGTGTLNAPVNVTFASGVGTATEYYGGEAAGTWTVTALNGSNNWGSTSATITGGTPTHVVITASPTSASTSTTTNIALGFQLEDAFNNNTTAGSGGVTLSVSSTSTKEFFSSSLGRSGSTPVNVTFASGVGTATEYYGDEAAGTWTVNALNGSSNWGSTAVTITAKTTGDTMTILTGNSQSTGVGAAFATALAVQDVDQFGNPVSGANVTFSAPVTGASGTFGTCSGGNPQTYQCVVATNASGQAISPTFTANTVSGSAYSVTTAVSGVASPPAFSETNTAGAPAQVYITPTPTSAAASTTTSIKLGFQLVDQYGNNATAGTGGVTLSVSSTSTKDFFSSANGGTGTLNAPVNVTFASGVGTATEYYGGEAAGTWTVTALNGSNNWGSTSATITGGTPTHVVITASPTSASTSTTTNIALGFQLEDAFNNNTTAGSGGVTLSVSSTSTKEFFSSSLGRSGSTPVNVTFASGVGTATEYYGDGSTGTWTVNALNGSSNWGSTTVTITRAF